MNEFGSTNLSKRMASFLLFLSCFDSLIYWVHCATPAEIEQHLSLGMSLLARGSYSDALSHFHAAVDRIMVLKPDFLKARQQRGGLLLKMGRFDEAHIDLENVVRKEPGNEEARGLYSTINTLREHVEEAM